MRTPNTLVEENRRPNGPPAAGSQFGSPFSVQQFFPAAAAHRGRSITIRLARNRSKELTAALTAEEVRALPLAQKVQIMESPWEDLRDRFEQSDVPQRIRDLLDQRRVRVREAAAKVLDWDAAKSGVGRA